MTDEEVQREWQQKVAYEAPDWKPLTRLGHLVYEGQITTMTDALRTHLPNREPEIADVLLGGKDNLADEILNVNMVQRMTDSGRRVNFYVVSVVGNKDGFVGLGEAKGKETGPTIKKSIQNAKTNMIEISRGCGSWECGCGKPHTMPFKVMGKVGSVKATFKPAPQGIGLATGDTPKLILELAGIKDAWGFTRGQNRTTVNLSKAVFDALKTSVTMRVSPDLRDRLHIQGGMPE